MDELRLFVAIPLSKPLLKRLADVQYRFQGKVPHQSVRWVRSEGIHLTLKFLGDTPINRVSTIEDALTVVGRNAPPCELTVEGLGCFPNPRRPRVLWVGVSEPTGRLEALQGAVEEAMVSLGYEAERRSFTPHLTLGRVRRGTSRQDEEQIGQAVVSTTVGQLAALTVDRFELIRSELKPSGAQYTTLETFSLLGGQV